MVDESLATEIEKYSPVRLAVIVRDLVGVSRGYGFVEMGSDEAAAGVVRMAARTPIVVGDRRLIVDVERGRTVRDWLPRRLGGGVGKGRSRPMSKRRIAMLRHLGLSAPSATPADRDRPSDRGQRDDRPIDLDADRYRDDRSRGSGRDARDRERDAERGGYTRDRPPRDPYRSRDFDRDRPQHDRRDCGERRDFGERRDYGSDRRDYGNDRRDYGSDRRDYGGDRRDYGGDRRDYGGDRREYGGGERRDYGAPRS